MIAFGPVPSRRLGRSLGINHIPPKLCSYACVYCQAGRTSEMRAEPLALYEPSAIAAIVHKRVSQTRKQGERIDYLTFVPDGEPTLDSNLGAEIELLRPLGIRIAVISNASLLWRAETRQALAQAECMSLKVDSVDEKLWREINRPHGHLRLRAILEGMLAFAAAYRGRLITETMLITGKNDSAASVQAVADFLARLRPAVAYLAIPTRPPAEPWVRPASEEAINQAYQILARAGVPVECLTGYEGNVFSSANNVEENLLGVTAVHPMREEAVRDMLSRARVEWSVVEGLIASGQLVSVEYGGSQFYLRRHPHWAQAATAAAC